MVNFLGRVVVTLVALVALITPGLCWSQEELDLFDLVEEIGENFYDLMQIDQDASSAEVKRAYRQLSLQLHPDKSDDPDAAENFRKMVAVSDVLKDEELREMYDEVLEEGLPDWKQPLFYYRRMRKMGLTELALLLLGMLSVAHYLYGWAVFVEKQIILQDLLGRKEKKDQRKSKHGKMQQTRQRLEAEVESLTLQTQASIPRIKDLLPVILAKHLIRLLFSGWEWLRWKLKERHSTPPPRDETAKGEEKTTEKEQNDSLERKRSKSGDGKHHLNGRVTLSAVEVNLSAESTDRRKLATCTADEEIVIEALNHSSLEAGSSEGHVCTVLTPASRGETNVACLSTASDGMQSTRKHVMEKTRALDISTSNKENDGSHTHNCNGGVVLGAKDDVAVKSHVRARNRSNKRENRLRDVALHFCSEVQTLSQVEQVASQNYTMGRDDKTNLEKTTPFSIDSATLQPKAGQDYNTGQDKSLDKACHEKTTPTLQPKVQDRILDKTNHEKTTPFSTNSTLQQPSLAISASDFVGVSEWTQFQQKQLELALARYPKLSKERWVNIAKMVPEKSLEECIERYKQIYAELKSKRTAH